MDIIEWCRKNDVWYLQLPLEIPEECIKEAQTVFEEEFFVSHISMILEYQRKLNLLNICKLDRFCYKN